MDQQTLAPDAPVVDILKAARAVIEKPEAWGRKAFARDAAGEFFYPGARGDIAADRFVNAWDEDAACFCALGAVQRVVGGAAPRHVTAALERAIPAGFADGQGWSPAVPLFNDHPDTTHRDVVDLYDRAIAAQENT